MPLPAPHPGPLQELLPALVTQALSHLLSPPAAAPHFQGPEKRTWTLSQSAAGGGLRNCGDIRTSRCFPLNSENL